MNAGTLNVSRQKPCEGQKTAGSRLPAKLKSKASIKHIINSNVDINFIRREPAFLSLEGVACVNHDGSMCFWGLNKFKKTGSPLHPREPWGQQSWSDVYRSMWCVSCWCLASGSPASTSNQSWFACCSSRMNSWGWSSPQIAVRGGKTAKGFEVNRTFAWLISALLLFSEQTSSKKKKRVQFLPNAIHIYCKVNSRCFCCHKASSGPLACHPLCFFDLSL